MQWPSFSVHSVGVAPQGDPQMTMAIDGCESGTLIIALAGDDALRNTHDDGTALL